MNARQKKKRFKKKYGMNPPNKVTLKYLCDVIVDTAEWIAGEIPKWLNAIARICSQIEEEIRRRKGER